jgi:hypothetical protein
MGPNEFTDRRTSDDKIIEPLQAKAAPNLKMAVHASQASCWLLVSNTSGQL